MRTGGVRKAGGIGRGEATCEGGRGRAHGVSYLLGPGDRAQKRKRNDGDNNDDEEQPEELPS